MDIGRITIIISDNKQNGSRVHNDNNDDDNSNKWLMERSSFAKVKRYYDDGHEAEDSKRVFNKFV